MFSYIMPGINDLSRHYILRSADGYTGVSSRRHGRGGTRPTSAFRRRFIQRLRQRSRWQQAGFRVLHRTILRMINRGAALAPPLTARINGYVGCAVKLNKTFELIFRILDDLVRALVANYEQDDVETKFLVPQKNLFISLM